MSHNISGIRDSRERHRLSSIPQYLNAEPRAGVAKPKPRPRGAARMVVLYDRLNIQLDNYADYFNRYIRLILIFCSSMQDTYSFDYTIAYELSHV